VATISQLPRGGPSPIKQSIAAVPPPVGDRPDTSVVVVDDHQIFTDLMATALALSPSIRCLGTASTAREGIELAGTLAPDVVMIDFQMPGLDGLAATRMLRSAHPEMAVALVSGHSGADLVARAARAGASAFIPKGAPLAELIHTLRAARPGSMVLAPSLMGAATADNGARVAQKLGLTPRELEVLILLVQGLPDKSIAKVLGISPHTCRGYIKTLYVVLHVNRRIDALNKARRLMLID
jgi:DNA-binding NarL/FixJ family response regulator